MQLALVELRERLGEIDDLSRAQGVLDWGPLGLDANSWRTSRARQLATLEAVVHEKQVDGRIGELLDELAPHAATLPPDDLDACVIRVARRNWERATRVPTELAAEIVQAQAESYQAWVEARENDDFAAFGPGSSAWSSCGCAGRSA